MEKPLSFRLETCQLYIISLRTKQSISAHHRYPVQFHFKSMGEKWMKSEGVECSSVKSGFHLVVTVVAKTFSAM